MIEEGESGKNEKWLLTEKNDLQYFRDKTDLIILIIGGSIAQVLLLVFSPVHPKVKHPCCVAIGHTDAHMLKEVVS